MNLYQTGLSKLYKEIEALDDPLTGISGRIDFERIRPIRVDLFINDTEKGGRLNYDPILMVKDSLITAVVQHLRSTGGKRDQGPRIIH